MPGATMITSARFPLRLQQVIRATPETKTYADSGECCSSKMMPCSESPPAIINSIARKLALRKRPVLLKIPSELKFSQLRELLSNWRDEAKRAATPDLARLCRTRI